MKAKGMKVSPANRAGIGWLCGVAWRVGSAAQGRAGQGGAGRGGVQFSAATPRDARTAEQAVQELEPTVMVYGSAATKVDCATSTTLVGTERLAPL